jgi:hypothetical protein
MQEICVTLAQYYLHIWLQYFFLQFCASIIPGKLLVFVLTYKDLKLGTTFGSILLVMVYFTHMAPHFNLYVHVINTINKSWV